MKDEERKFRALVMLLTATSKEALHMRVTTYNIIPLP